MTLRMRGLSGLASVVLWVALSQPAAAQPTAKVHRVGFLSGSAAGAPRTLDAFREQLRALGWVEGQNVVIDARYTGGRADRLADVAAELVASKVDLIAAGGATASLAAKNATSTVPIVMVAAGEPVALGLVATLARPGGNVTGVAWDVGLETLTKSLELFKETMPKLRRLGVLSNPSNPGQPLAVQNLEAVSGKLGLQLHFVEARDAGQLDDAFAATVKQRAEALLVITDPLFIGQRARIAEWVNRSQVPSMFGAREFVEEGGLMSYGPSLQAAFQRAAILTDKILKGQRPADLPVEQPTKFELTINLRTAEKLGMTVPQSLLLRADEIIK